MTSATVRARAIIREERRLRVKRVLLTKHHPGDKSYWVALTYALMLADVFETDPGKTLPEPACVIILNGASPIVWG